MAEERRKRKLGRRLRYTHFAENLSTELARKESQKGNADEGEDARGRIAPRVPSKAERQVHELTRWPCQDWAKRIPFKEQNPEPGGQSRHAYHLDGF